MKALTNIPAVRYLQGFKVYTLNNECVELAVVPQLGAKIVSLKNLQTGREWLWHPQSGFKLFQNHIGDDFSKSPLVGIDECFPTIAPCSWRGRQLPDHGELWNQPWLVDDDAWENGVLKTTIRLSISPFVFERTIELNGNEVRIGYELTNLNTAEEKFVWAIHPLLKLQSGDRLELPESTRALLKDETWIDAVDSVVPGKNCAKTFVTPVSEGVAAITNPETGERLELEWNPMENNTLGLWLTRGGWHGHHHFAIEPTNSDTDALTLAAESNHCGIVGASSSMNWQLGLRLGS